MALQKDIKQSNGVMLQYHRIAMVKVDVNQQITILVESYLNEAARNYEKRYAAGEIEGEPSFPYTHSEYLWTDYDAAAPLLGGNVVTQAYEYIKTIPAYQGAKNV